MKNLSMIDIIKIDKTPIINFSCHKKFVIIMIYMDKQRIKVNI